MGDRVSISFKHNEFGESVSLFSHWGGRQFIKTAKAYIKNLPKPASGGRGPLDRREPQTVMVDFIRYLTKDLDRVEGDIYLGKDHEDGDNSNNGHHTINIGKGD